MLKTREDSLEEEEGKDKGREGHKDEWTLEISFNEWRR
jgi:hypothetical protein